MLRKTTNSLIHILLLAAISLSFTACNSDDDDNSSDYDDWRKYNEAWLVEQTTLTNPDGTAFYAPYVMPTDPQAYVLKHQIGEVNNQNLTPLFTSTTKVNYTLKLCNDSIVDSGANFVSQLNSTGLISGWSMAVMSMHVGDSAQFIIPYGLGYGSAGAAVVPPYSNLVFNIRLVDITAYEIRP